MIENIKNELLSNEEIDFSDLDSVMVELGYRSVYDFSDVDMILESGSVVYEYPADKDEEVEPVEIFFSTENGDDNINTIVIKNIERYL